MSGRRCLARALAAGVLAAGPVVAQLVPAVNVSDSASDTESGRFEIAIDPVSFAETVIVNYSDGPVGEREIYVRISHDGGAAFVTPANLSNTADDVNVLGAPGDSSDPRIAVQGNTVLVAWIDTFCPGGTQGAYDPGTGPRAFACVYTARSLDGGETWNAAEQLTDGARDAANITLAGSGSGFALTWQEDPEGLQPGEGEGPGPGGSGAHTTPGTDIYYSALSMADVSAGVAFPSPAEVTDNVADTSGAPAASRPQVRLVGAAALLAYEETKGGGLEGKVIRWHQFGFTSPPTGSAGTVLSDAAENSRRVRIIAQGPAAAGLSGTVALVLYRQGIGGMGAPADILGRRAVGGFGAANFAPAFNLTSSDLDDSTDANPFENARAHRAVLRGDLVVFNCVYTADDAASQAQNGNYNAYVRVSEDGGVTWSEPANVSGITNFSINVTEPRLIGTPASVPSGDPSDVQNPDVVFVAWGTETNESSPVPLDLFFSRSTQRGFVFGPPQSLAQGPSEQSQSQIRSAPDGNRLCASWMDDVTGAGDVFFACGDRFSSPVAVPAVGTGGLATLALLLALAALRRS